MDTIALTHIQKPNTQSENTVEKIYWIFFVIIVMLKCVYFQFTTKLNSIPFYSADNVNMLISTFSVLLIIISMVFAMFNRKRNLALFILDILLTIILLADTNFFRYYYKVLSIPVLYQFDFKSVGLVSSSIASLFRPKDIIYVSDLAFMLAGLLYLNKKKPTEIEFKKRVVMAGCGLIMGLTMFFSINSEADMESLSVNDNFIIKNTGVFYYHFYDTKSFIKDLVLENEDLSPEEKNLIKNFFENKNKRGSKYNGVASNKNLIVVQMEAMQEFVIGRKINGKEVTPNLNKLAMESFYFKNMYYQVAGGNTSDAEFLSNISLYPAREGSVYYQYPSNKYYSLAELLKNKGYSTYAFHAFTPGFWNRDEMYKNIQFDKFICKDDFVLDDFAGWDGESALSDESFFRQALEKIDASKPFYSFLVTLSSHHPFTYFQEYSFDVGEFEGTYIGNYLKAANYADYAIGQLVEQLKEKGLYDNTLLVLYGDHSAVPEHQANELMGLLDAEFSEVEWMKLQKVPCIIHYPNMKKGEEVNIIGGQIDIMPTIANLIGLEAPYAMGKDLLNTPGGYAVLRNGSVVTGKFIYLGSNDEVYDYKTGQPLKKEVYRERIKAYLDQLNISDTIIAKDVFKGSEEEDFEQAN